MKRLIGATAICSLLGGTVLLAAGPDQGKSQHAKHAKHETATAKSDGAVVAASVHVVFGKGDITILRNHYAPRYRDLPPGLKKKVARGGSLPPGWQKKYEPFPTAIERQLPPLPRGYSRGVISGNAVIYNSRTNVVVDVAVLF
jgi:hypothetical protein